MINQLLVPLDGSPLAEMALDPAVVLARRFDAEIVLVRVTPFVVSKAFDQASSTLSPAEAHSYLYRVAHRLREEGGVAHTVVSDTSAEGIDKEAVLEQVGLIVLTTQGHTRLEAWLHPSLTWQVLARTNAPLLIVQCGEGETPGHRQLPRFMATPTVPIMVPPDGSREAERALPLAAVLAHTFGNSLLLVRAVEPVYVEPVYYFGMDAHPELGNEVRQAAMSEARRYLQGQQDALSKAGFQVAIALEEAPAAAWIEACIQESQAGLVVMALRGRKGLRRFHVGRVAHSVLGQVQVPLQLVRQDVSQSTPGLE